MNASERRQRLRRHFAGNECIRPASVFDPISARIATDLGFEYGMLGGSIASHTVLGAPDLAVITLTELADQCRRITRASELSLLVDADNGYGNALSVMRTIEELEVAGVAGMTIEDTILPQRFGHQGQEELIAIDEMTGKLRAAVAARQDAGTVILARTHAINATSFEDAIERVRAYEQTGVDGLFLLGIKIWPGKHTGRPFGQSSGPPQSSAQELPPVTADASPAQSPCLQSVGLSQIEPGPRVPSGGFRW